MVDVYAVAERLGDAEGVVYVDGHLLDDADGAASDKAFQ
jgi:hypothetical protein